MSRGHMCLQGAGQLQLWTETYDKRQGFTWVHWNNNKPRKWQISVMQCCSEEPAVTLCPTQLHPGGTERGKPVSDALYSRNSNYLLRGSMMNLVMKLTCVNMSLEGPQWCDMENWEKILSFRSISASLGSAIVTLLQNIYMTSLLIFLSSCHFLCLTHDMGLWWYPRLYGKTLVANPGYQLQHIKWAASVKVRKHLLS